MTKHVTAGAERVPAHPPALLLPLLLLLLGLPPPSTCWYQAQQGARLLLAPKGPKSVETSATTPWREAMQN